MDNAQIDTAIREYKIPGEEEIIQAYVRIFEALRGHYLSKGLRPQRAGIYLGGCQRLIIR
jgi:hypothetical protein